MSFKALGVVTDSASHIGTDPFAIAVPAGVEDGDLLFMIANRNASGLYNTPAGWTQVTALHQSSTSFKPFSTLLAYKTANAEPVSYSITHTDSTGKAQSGVIVAYDPVDAAVFDVTPVAAHSLKQADNNTPVVPDITTVTDGALLLALQWVSNAEITNAAGPSGFTMRLDHTPFTDRNILIADMVQTTAGLVSPGAWQHTTSAQYGDGATAILALKPLPANQPPVADDNSSFSISDNIQNGETVGTYTATDSDGTVVSYSITGTTLAIDNAGLITIADNTGITAGTPITATVTATDDDGATDTALITITVTAPKPGIQTVGTIRLGETVPVTVDNAVDLSAATTVTTTYGGVSVTVSNIAANSFSFTAPSAGLELGANHDLIVTADGESSVAWSQAFLPPTGYDYVVLTGIDTNSWLNKPQYTGNAGGDANNIGASDQIVYKNTTNEAGTAVTISAVGLPEMPDAVTEGVTVNQTINWFYLDAQDSYAAGPEAVLTLLAPDTEAPVITLNGAASMVWVQGTAWIDPGATVTDNVDATRSITSSVSPNVNLAGTYVLPYDATDAGGNAASTVNRTVIVSSADTTPNQFAFVDVNNAELNTLYENTQSITGVDAGQTLTAINGQLSNDNGSTWASSVQMVTGQTLVKASITTGSTNSFEHTVVVEVNGITDTFSVTTKAAVTRTFSIGSSDPVVDTAGNNVTYTYPIWALYDKIPEDVTAVIIDSGVNFSVTNGVGSIQTSAAQLGTNYILVARDSGNSPANYIRTVGQVS